MAQNLFDNAKFGDMFLTAENKQAVFLRFAENAEHKFAILYIEGWGNVQVFRHNGKEVHDDVAYSIIKKQEESVSERLTFRAIPRLLEMIEPTDKAKAYIAKLADILEVEGYSTDAKIVREIRKIMNGEKVPMSTMDGEPLSEELDKAAIKFSKGWAEWDYASACFKAGAEWQKEQFEKNRMHHCETLTEEQAKIESDFVVQHMKNNNRPLTCIDAIEYGMKLQKEQILKKEL